MFVCICPATDISATVRPMVELRPERSFSLFNGDIFSGLEMQGQKWASGGPFLVSQTPVFAI